MVMSTIIAALHNCWLLSSSDSIIALKGIDIDYRGCIQGIK